MGIGYFSSYCIEGSVEASSCTPSDRDVGTYHGHKCGNAVGEEGPGPGEDWGNEGFVLGSHETKKLF